MGVGRKNLDTKRVEDKHYKASNKKNGLILTGDGRRWLVQGGRKEREITLRVS